MWWPIYDFGILGTGARFVKAPEAFIISLSSLFGSFRARKTIFGLFGSSVTKHGEVYTPETCCMKGTSVHIENM